MRTMLLFVLLGVSAVCGNGKMSLFPVPEGKELRVHFWVNVFTQYSVMERIIHDEDEPERIYRVIDLSRIDPEGRMSGEMLETLVDREVERIALLLRKLGTDTTEGESASVEERRIIRLFGSPADRRVFTRASHRVHVQEGVRERFLTGIRHSQEYLDDIRSILEEEGLPMEIAYLPHVESSFHPEARSKDGAVGLWQFTRGTGMQYLRILGDVDERKDPILSTRAAARHLRTNHRTLGSWPLALTAYNYGLEGMRRIVRRWGTKDLGRIIDGHRDGRFGYASKNFYLEFIAAVRVAENARAYFPEGGDPSGPGPKRKSFRIPPPRGSGLAPVQIPLCDSGCEGAVLGDREPECRRTGVPCRAM